MKSLTDIEKITDLKIRLLELDLYEKQLKIKEGKSKVRVLNRTKQEFVDEKDVVSAVDRQLIKVEKCLYMLLVEADECEDLLDVLTK